MNKENDDRWFTEFWKECTREEEANNARIAEEESVRVQETKKLAIKLFGENLPTKSIGAGEIVVFGPPGSREKEYTLVQAPGMMPAQDDNGRTDVFRVKGLDEVMQIAIRSKGGLLRAIRQFDAIKEEETIRQQSMLVEVQKAITTILEFADVSLILDNVEEE